MKACSEGSQYHIFLGVVRPGVVEDSAFSQDECLVFAILPCLATADALMPHALPPGVNDLAYRARSGRLWVESHSEPYIGHVDRGMHQHIALSTPRTP